MNCSEENVRFKDIHSFNNGEINHVGRNYISNNLFAKEYRTLLQTKYLETNYRINMQKQTKTV